MSDEYTYLYYLLNIEPKDDIACKIKENLDLEKISQKEGVLVNEQIKEYAKTNKRFMLIINNDYIDTYYYKYHENDHEIEIIFHKIRDIKKILSEKNVVLTELDIFTTITRHINLTDNYLFEYEHYFQYSLRKNIKNRFFNIITNYSNDKYLQQMSNIENNIYCNFYNQNKLLFLKNKIYDYTNNEFLENDDMTKIKGGLLIKDNESDKIFQMLNYIVSNGSETLVILPDYLKQIWIDSFVNNFNVAMPNFLTIATFDEFENFKNKNYKRIIIEQIHDLRKLEKYVELVNWCLNYDCEYKWVMTSLESLYENHEILFDILNFISGKYIYYHAFYKANRFLDLYSKIFM